MANSDFVTQFYNLEGDLLPERKKNFFKLLKAQPPLNEDDLKSLHPRTHLERLFQIDIFIHFKICPKLLEVIKGGNEIFISKILKHPSLLLEVIGNITPETFVNNFLPSTSYAMRMKILKKISFVLSESQMDDIVTAVHKRYGFNIATKFIHTCSSRKIKDFLLGGEVMLKPRQVQFIFDKDPDLFLFFLNYYEKSTGKAYSHRNVCKYVALKNTKMWFKLHKEQKISPIRLGRRTSKHFLHNSSDDILSNVKCYSEFVNLEVIVRNLHGNFKEVYFKFFPKNSYNINTYNFSHRLLKYYPKKKQWDMFAQTYCKVFGSDILDNLICLNSDFIKLFPNKSVMNKWAEEHYKISKSNDMLKYCDPNTAIPLIKEKINVTSDIYERKRLIMILLEICHKNEDLMSLEAVLKYICFRHRNEEYTSEILNEIKCLFQLENLNENHWNHINEMLTILKLRKQSYYGNVKFYLGYIEYLILQGKPFRKEVTMYINEVKSNEDRFYLFLKNKDISRQILIEIIKIYRDVKQIDDIAFNQKFIDILIDFNEDNAEHMIDLSDFPGFLPYIKSLLDSDFKKLEDNARKLVINVINYNFKFPEKPIIIIEESQVLKILQQDDKEYFTRIDIVEKSIKKINRSKFENDILEFFWNCVIQNSNRSYFCKNIIQWLLLNDPKSVFPYFDRIWTINQEYVKIKDIKFMSHFGFDNKVLDYCTSKLVWYDNFLKNVLGTKSLPSSNKVETELEKEIDVDTYKNVIQYLSVLLPTKEYIEIISKRFLPVKEKIDITDEALNQIYCLQCEAAKSLKKLHVPAVVLPTVMKFCLGDYLQSALPSLYSVCYRAPEELLYSYMDILSKRAVSARKHALFLSCEILNYDYVLSRLQTFDESQVSSQKHMFSATLKYFYKNPCDEILNLVAINLNTIDKNDQETLNSLVNIDVPKKYKTIYILKCWYFFENIRSTEVHVQHYLQMFFNSIIDSQDILMSLPVDFLKHIITHYFKRPLKEDHYLTSINRFVCLFLRDLKSEQVNNFKFIFDIISSFRTQDVKMLFDEFYSSAVQDIKDNATIDTVNNYYIELFKQHWFNIFSPVKMFREHVLLNLLYLKCKSNNITKNYAIEVVNYLEELIAEYGPYIYYSFKELVLHKHTFTKKEIYSLIYSILKFKKSSVNYILAIDLVRCQSCDEEVEDTHNEIMRILKESNDPLVSVYFNSYFV